MPNSELDNEDANRRLEIEKSFRDLVTDFLFSSESLLYLLCAYGGTGEWKVQIDKLEVLRERAKELLK